MAVSTRITPIATTINLVVANTLSVKARILAIAAFAKGAIDEADATNARVLGRIPPRTVTVDGRVGAALESVNPDGGIIIVEWALVSDVLVWIGETLRARSPVHSGSYRNSHTLFADGLEVPIGGNVPEANEYVFLNHTPYARKIEVGKTRSGRDFVIQVANRIYERTASDAISKFGNVAKIGFIYRAPFNGNLLGYVSVRNAASRKASHHERSLRVPAIVVTLRNT